MNVNQIKSHTCTKKPDEKLNNQLYHKQNS